VKTGIKTAWPGKGGLSSGSVYMSPLIADNMVNMASRNNRLLPGGEVLAETAEAT
jgi:hypothetical protein